LKYRIAVRCRAFFHVALGWLYRGLLLFLVISILLVLLFRWLPPPLSGLMVQRYVQHIWEGQKRKPTIYYDWVAYEEISPYMALAVVAAEDQKFPIHFGFDLQAIQQAFKDRIRGKTLRGASTISQQVVKNLYLWHGRSWLRKALEVWFTLLLELLWSKQRTLEIYLNIIELGDRTYGVEAASQRFFKKPAHSLSREEAALLAAVLPNPLTYHANAPSSYVRERQAWILRQMQQLGGISYLEQL
jgi:monofunctional biosynthetic peptidoglycan transglycosylase